MFFTIEEALARYQDALLEGKHSQKELKAMELVLDLDPDKIKEYKQAVAGDFPAWFDTIISNKRVAMIVVTPEHLGFTENYIPHNSLLKKARRYGLLPCPDDLGSNLLDMQDRMPELQGWETTLVGTNNDEAQQLCYQSSSETTSGKWIKHGLYLAYRQDFNYELNDQIMFVKKTTASPSKKRTAKKKASTRRKKKVAC